MFRYNVVLIPDGDDLVSTYGKIGTWLCLLREERQPEVIPATSFYRMPTNQTFCCFFLPGATSWCFFLLFIYYFFFAAEAVEILRLSIVSDCERAMASAA